LTLQYALVLLRTQHSKSTMCSCCHSRCTRGMVWNWPWSLCRNEILMGLYATQPIDILRSARPLGRKFALRHLRAERVQVPCPAHV